jgi:hypothetical protein
MVPSAAAAVSTCVIPKVPLVPSSTLQAGSCAVRCLPKLQGGRLQYVFASNKLVSNGVESALWARCRAGGA